MENKATSDVLGVILAGGLSRRMGGGDKALLKLAGKPVLSHVIGRFAPQVGRLVLNANGDPARWQGFGLEVVPDGMAEFPGPLAGLLASMEWAAINTPECRWIASVSCDTPFLPRDLVARLRGEGGRAAIAASAVCIHPVAGLFDIRLRDDLAAYLAAGGRKAGEWARRAGAGVAMFAADPVDPFFNINTPEELAEAERLGVDWPENGETTDD
jgi:molybdopterin-guanine dinucleotide biosynthesis protein A